MATTLFCVLCAIIIFHEAGASLISSSEIKYCTRTSSKFEPMLTNGQHCEKKFLVTLAVRNGQKLEMCLLQSQPDQVYANLAYVNNNTGPISRREQLKRPFRIYVYKSPVIANYPIEFHTTTNNQPREWSHNVKNKILGINTCDVYRHCRINRESLNGGFCCASSSKEKMSKRWEYKRGHGKKEGHYFSHKYSQAVCMTYDPLWYIVYKILDPHLSYSIFIAVEQLEHVFNITTKKEEAKWTTVGRVRVGPIARGAKIQKSDKWPESPEVTASWEGDFAGSSSLPNLKSKVLLVPYYFKKPKVVSPQFNVGPEKWLMPPLHMVDHTRRTCRMLGAGAAAFHSQIGRCYRMTNSCFDTWTPSWLYHQSRMMYERKGRKSPLYPTFHGKLFGIYQESEKQQINMKYDVTSKVNHQSLVTLTFVADSVSFVENRSPGRIVETLLEDFTVLNGGGLLTVIVQNTGSFTADYSVSVDECTEGIVRVAQQTQSLDPRQQGTVEWEMSSGINTDLDHNCTVILSDQDGSILDTKPIHFKTLENCVYCSDGQCNCSCNAKPENNSDCRSEYLDHFYKPKIVIVHPCYHCWFTDSFRDPYTCTFSVVLLMMMLGMLKMLCMFCCCRTSDGRYVDVSAILLGTASQEHTRVKQRSATLQFLLGVCFFVYLPFLPCIIVFCSWRRRSKARARLKKKAVRKQERLRAKKQAALLAMKGMMVQENATLDEALKIMEEGQMPGGQAPTLPPRIIVVSSSSGTDNQDFNYTSSSEDMTLGKELGLTQKQASSGKTMGRKDRGTGMGVGGMAQFSGEGKGRGNGRGRGRGRGKDAIAFPGGPGHMKKGGKMADKQKQGRGGEKMKGELVSGERGIRKNKREEKYAEFDQMMRQSHEVPAFRPGKSPKRPQPEKPTRANTEFTSFMKGKGGSGGGRKKSGGGKKSSKKSGCGKKKGERRRGEKSGRMSCKSGGHGDKGGKRGSKGKSSASSGSEDGGGSKHGSDGSNDQDKSAGEGEHHSEANENEEHGAEDEVEDGEGSHGEQDGEESHNEGDHEGSHGDENDDENDDESCGEGEDDGSHGDEEYDYENSNDDDDEGNKNEDDNDHDDKDNEDDDDDDKHTDDDDDDKHTDDDDEDDDDDDNDDEEDDDDDDDDDEEDDNNDDDDDDDDDDSEDDDDDDDQDDDDDDSEDDDDDDDQDDDDDDHACENDDHDDDDDIDDDDHDDDDHDDNDDDNDHDDDDHDDYDHDDYDDHSSSSH